MVASHSIVNICIDRKGETCHKRWVWNRRCGVACASVDSAFTVPLQLLESIRGIATYPLIV